MSTRNRAPEPMALSDRFRQGPQKRLDFIPGKMIVKIRREALEPAAGTLRSGGARLSARVKADLPDSVTGPFEYLRANAGLKRATPLFAAAGARIQGLSAASAAVLSSVADSPHEDLAGFTVVSVDPGKEMTKLAKHLSSPAIQFAEPMPARWIQRKPMAAASVQWALSAIGYFSAAHPSKTKAKKVKIAVLDTGIDNTHPEFKGMIASYDHQGTRTEDVLGHGTHVAGIICAIGKVISGVSSCRLNVWKIFDDEPEFGDFYVNGERYLRALGLLADQGSRVVNLSIGGSQQSRAEALLFKRLRERNVLPVAAMGNEFLEGNLTSYPAAYDGVIAVGAITSQLRRASFSNTGNHIWIAAPGHTIISTVPMKKSAHREETEYAVYSGTSMATPYVAGAAGAFFAKYSGSTANQAQTALKNCAKKLAEMSGKPWTKAHGHGLLWLPKLL